MARHIRETRKGQQAQESAWKALNRIGVGSVPSRPLRREIEPGKALYDILPDRAWTGRRAFIIGGGPSLRDFDFERIRGELIIGVNMAFMYADCQIMFSMDTQLHDWLVSGRLGEKARQEFADFPGMKVWLDSHPHSFSPGIRILKDAGIGGLSSSLKDGVCHGENSGYAALNIAVCLGANPIYLLGIDGKLAADGRAHHHDEYPSPTTQGVLDKFTRYFHDVAPLLMARGIRVVNLNPDSAVRCFEFGRLEDIKDLGKKGYDSRGYVVVSFYTEGTGYAKEIKWLEASLDRFRIQHHLFAVQPLKDWRDNLNYKSACILKAFDMFPGKDIVWLDADAIVRKDPVLFDQLSAEKKYDISAHFFHYEPRSGDADELLSGTLWIQNNAVGRALVTRWHEVGLERPDVRHQMCLKAAIEDLEKAGTKVRVLRHPIAYTRIFDYYAARDVEPVIEHFQASRRLRREVGFGQDLVHRRD